MNDADLDASAYRLFQLAGRPDGLWASLTEYERDAWRRIVRELWAMWATGS